jgi:hypothetical protein
MSNVNPKWLDNSIQFPRLLAEINANVDMSVGDMVALCESMDLNPLDINELFDRADEEWERIKKENC